MNHSRTHVPVFWLLLTAALSTAHVLGQENRLQELNSQVKDLYSQGKYAEATSLAAQAAQIAEATYGPDDARLASALNNLAALYQEQGKYAEAEPLYQRALRIDEKALGPDDPALATDLNNFAELYRVQGKYAEAEPLYQRALRIDEQALGPDNPAVATALDNLAQLFRNQGKYAEAEPLFQRALRIDEQALGPDNPAVATDLNNLAELYRVQGKYTEAGPLFQRALRIDEEALSPDNPAVATALNNLAQLYRDQGKYAEAEPLFQRALGVYEKALGPDHHLVAAALNNLAAVYADQGKYADAEPLYQRMLRIDEKALGPEHPAVASALNNFAAIYWDQGKYAEAEPLLQRSLAIREKALGSDHPLVAATLNNLAALYLTQGRYVEAEPLYQRALRIDENALGPDHPAVATSLGGLALLYKEQGKYAEAEPLYQRSLAIKEKALGPDHPDVAYSLNSLAELYWAQGSYAKAEPLFQRALNIDEKALGPDHPDVARDLASLASLYLALARYAEAEPALHRCLAIQEKALGSNHPDVALTLNSLAALYFEQGKYAQAEPLYQRALRIDERALGPDHSGVATDLDNLAELYSSEGNYAEAEPLYQRSLDNLFHQFQYNFTYMTERDRLSFLDKVSFQFPVYFSFVHRYRGQDPGLTGSMYNLLLWEKGFIAASIAGMRRQIEASGDQQALDLLNQLSARRTQIAALLNTNPPDRDLWRKQIDQLRAEADSIEKSLVARSSAFAEQKKLERSTWQQVRDALRPSEAAVEFARFRYYDKKWTDTYYYVALVVTPETKDQPAYIFLGDSKQVEGDALTRFQQSTQTRGFVSEEQAALPGANAYDLIWKPVEQAFGGATRIVISPDGVLNTIPLGIIPGPGGKLLMERYDLRLVSSTKDILRAASQPSANTALLLGDPTFTLAADQQRAALEKLSLPQPPVNLQLAALSPNTLSRDATGAAELPPLPGTGAEVSAIAELMQSHGWKVSMFTKDLALKRVVEQASSPRVMHLATHGFFFPDQQIKTDRMALGETQSSGMEDPMLRSGLYFAGADRTLAGKPSPEGLDNGVLTAMEAGNLNLTGTELVILSACNTGQGDVKNGEGVFGLRRAFEEAGAQAVLMSLWSVPDKETQELMKSFYTRWLSGMEMHKALKEAQLEMREKVKREHDGRDLPYYWGAFVLVGR